MKPRAVIGLIAFLCLAPTVALAASINSLQSNTVLDDDLAAFRYRVDPGLWQRSSLQAQAVTDAEVFAGSIYYAVQDSTNSYRIVSSPDGLRFADSFTSQTPITLTGLDGALLGTAADQAVVVTATNQAVFSLPAHSYSNPQDYFAQTNVGTTFTVIANNRADIYLLQTSASSPRWSFSCTTANFFRAPVPLLQCDNAVWRYQNGAFVQLLDGVTYLAGSEQLRLWHAAATGEFYLYDGAVTALTFSDFQEGDTLEVVGERLFYRKTSGLFEVAWRLPAVDVVALPETGSLRISDGGKKVILHTATKLYYSKSFGSWVETNVAGLFSLHSSAGGLVAYLPDGSGAFYEDQPLQFIEMDSSWAASSKIKAFGETPQGLLLVLRNSSNNPNIYRSIDFRTWQRITMPTAATHLVGISEARNLPADTIVEVAGTITVLPGFAGDEVVYLEDGLAGIQLFLSKSKGEYSLTGPVQVVAIGKISPSSIGRILLDAANTLVVGSSAVIIEKEYSIAEAKSRLGQTALLRGALSATATDTATLTDGSGAVKLHYDGIKSQFKNGDTILVRTVVDTNSATDQVEAWFAGGTAKLITAVPQEDTETATPVKTTAKSSATLSSRSLGISAVAAQGSAKLTTVPKEAKEAPRVAAARTEKELPNVVVFAAGLAAGALIIRGRRFQRYFS